MPVRSGTTAHGHRSMWRTFLVNASYMSFEVTTLGESLLAESTNVSLHYNQQDGAIRKPAAGKNLSWVTDTNANQGNSQRYIKLHVHVETCRAQEKAPYTTDKWIRVETQFDILLVFLAVHQNVTSWRPLGNHKRVVRERGGNQRHFSIRARHGLGRSGWIRARHSPRRGRNRTWHDTV